MNDIEKEIEKIKTKIVALQEKLVKLEAKSKAKRWKPRVHGIYYHISFAGEVQRSVWTDRDFEIAALKHGNVYRTKEAAEAVVSELFEEVLR